MPKTPLAVIAGKLAAKTIQIAHLGSASSLPGKVALKLDAGLLGTLGRQIKTATVAITGTNGKSTTAGLLSAFVEAAHYSVVHNQLGANMLPGITTALLQKASPSGTLSVEYGVIEVDEASLPTVAQSLQQTVTVVTNLFRDQLDRYGELDTTAKMIEKGIANSGGKLILNADDPMVAAMGRHFPPENVFYFGVEKVDYPATLSLESPVLFPREVTDCPVCQAALEYTLMLYGHLGHYHCPACGFSRPTPTWAAQSVEVHTLESLIYLDSGAYTLPLPGLFNAYNFLAATAAAQFLGFAPNILTQGIASYHSLFGRAERKQINGKNVLILLIKNPMGAAEVLKVVCADPNARILIAINDHYADGRDISWLWDAPFEWLATQPRPIRVSGTRAHDMAVRLQYAGIPVDNVLLTEALSEAWHHSLDDTLAPEETLYILPTYTALLALSRQIGSR